MRKRVRSNVQAGGRLIEVSMLVLHVLLRRGVAGFTARPAAVVTPAWNARTLLSSQPQQRFMAKASRNEDKPSDSPKRPDKNKKTPKFTINKEVSPSQAKKLAAAFDELARKEGFTSSTARFASDTEFEEDFSEKDFMKFSENDMKDYDYDKDDDDDDYTLNSDFDSLDFDEGSEDLDDDDLDGGLIGPTSADTMAARIAAAKRDGETGRVTVPKDLDRLAHDAKPQTLRQLGFRPELDPFGNDETPRKAKYNLVIDAMSCSACGADFQSKDEKRPGFLPGDKFEAQQKLSKIEEMRKLQQKAKTAEWTPDDEIEYLIQTSGKKKDGSNLVDLDVNSMAEEMGVDLDELASKKVVCKRCHGLQNFGKVDNALRPGWSEDPVLAQERFRALLRPISEKKAVIIALVDLFDFSGSVLPELDSIAGPNPVIIAANKADLLPSKMGPQRAQNWVRRELEYLGVKSLANVGGAVRLVSCKTGMGVPQMLDKARRLADEMDCDIYVVGAANAGKSTLLNYILRNKEERKEVEADDIDQKKKKRRAGNQNASKGAVTVSPLPGTTLKFIKVELERGRSLYDTPGLLVNGTLTQLLTPEELKIVVPKKKVEPVTFRVSSGKCVLIGGLARVAIIGESKPFFLTIFVANDIKIHLTDISKADEYRRKHAGGVLTPPLPPGDERLSELGEFEHHIIDIEGRGWTEAAADITLTGLGWVVVTGPGTANVQVSVPKGIAVSVRPPLMPYDMWDSTAKYTGSRSVRKVKKGRTGVGRN